MRQVKQIQYWNSIIYIIYTLNPIFHPGLRLANSTNLNKQISSSKNLLKTLVGLPPAKTQFTASKSHLSIQTCNKNVKVV